MVRVRSLVVVVIALAGHAALACPPGRPCPKVVHSMQTIVDKPSWYLREDVAPMPKFDRTEIVRVHRIEEMVPPEPAPMP